MSLCFLVVSKAVVLSTSENKEEITVLSECYLMIKLERSIHLLPWLQEKTGKNRGKMWKEQSWGGKLKYQ